MKILLTRGADVNAQSERCGTALQEASAKGHNQIVQQLLEAGADVKAEGKKYGTAMQAALAKGHDQIAQRLRLRLAVQGQ